MIQIRPYQPQDAFALWQIHCFTIRNINIRDYSQEQVEAWAPNPFDQTIWQNKMQDIQPFVAWLDDKIVGYTDLQDNGLLDHFFCHHEHQKQGIGKALMQHVFDQAQKRNIHRLWSEVSITARPFYEHMGFKVIKEQQVETRGQVLTNFVMEKNR